MAFRFLWKTVAIVEKHRMAFLAVSCTGLLGANLTFHLFPDQTFRPLYQAWAKGEPAEVSGSFQNLFRGTLHDIQLKSVNCYRAFVSFSFHPVSAGLPQFPAGCVIGIPISFGAADLDEHGIFSDVAVIARKEVDWRSVEGLALKEALKLSPEAQRFAIAREIIYLQNYSPLVCAAVAPLWFAGTYVTGIAVKQLLGLYSGPRLVRGLYNVAVVAIGYLGYCLSYDTVNKALDYQADRNTATISTDFARGGVEFYDKVLSQNKILRILMGKRGEEIYTPSGNLFPRRWFRLQPASYTSRRDLIINILSMPQA